MFDATESRKTPVKHSTKYRFASCGPESLALVRHVLQKQNLLLDLATYDNSVRRGSCFSTNYIDVALPQVIAQGDDNDEKFMIEPKNPAIKPTNEFEQSLLPRCAMESLLHNILPS